MCVNLNEYELLAWPSVVGRYKEALQRSLELITGEGCGLPLSSTSVCSNGYFKKEISLGYSELLERDVRMYLAQCSYNLHLSMLQVQ